MKSFVIVCAVVCGVSVGVLLSHTSIIYTKKMTLDRGLPSTPGGTQLTGSVVEVDLPKKLITLQIMSPYDASGSYRATLSYDERTVFRVVNENAVLGSAGISTDQFPRGMKVQATVARTPGNLYMKALFGSMAL